MAQSQTEIIINNILYRLSHQSIRRGIEDIVDVLEIHEEAIQKINKNIITLTDVLLAIKSNVQKQSNKTISKTKNIGDKGRKNSKVEINKGKLKIKKRDR